MEHFTDERWSDYAIGMLPASHAAAIHQHLEAGCEQCHHSFRLWRTVVETAGMEPRCEVPERLIHASQAAYVAWCSGRMGGAASGVKEEWREARGVASIILEDRWRKKLDAASASSPSNFLGSGNRREDSRRVDYPRLRNPD